MFLPNEVLYCIDALALHGFRAYAVGGCVRDSLLGLTPQDYDLCTDAPPEQIRQIFASHTLVRSGEKHGTVGVVIDTHVYEITTFRTEGGYTDSRHPGWVRFVPDLQQDLARRDFTVNAMAYNPKEGLIDPWGGCQDLQNKVLRAVGDPTTRFTEDALRILRGVRFAVRYDLVPEPETQTAMVRLSPLMENLARERVFDELCKLFPLLRAEDLLRFAPVITAVIPELASTLDFDQHSPHHIYDVYTHTAHVVAATPPKLTLRWAALLHDTGKVPAFTQDETGRGHFYGHASISGDIADAVLRRLKSPTALREQVVLLIRQHMTPLEPDRKLLRRRLSQHGAETVRNMLALQQADFHGKGTGTPREEAVFDEIAQVLDSLIQEDACLGIKDLTLSGTDLLRLGYAPGPGVGKCLAHLLNRVLDETLPNTKPALLEEAERYRKEELL